MRNPIRPWTKDEEEFLLKNYLALTYDEIGKKLERSSDSVRGKLYRLGFVKFKSWSEKELEILRKNYGKMSNKELSNLIPSRSIQSIQSRALNEKLGRFKRLQEIEYSLSEDIAKIAAWLIAAEGSISLHKVRNKYFCPKVWIRNTDKELLDRFFELTKIGSITKEKRQNSKWNDIYIWSIANVGKCYVFLKQISPHLPSKKKQAELVMEYCKIRLNNPNKINDTVTLYQLYRETHELNSRGAT